MAGGALNPAFVLASLSSKISQDDVVLNEAIRNGPVLQEHVKRTKPQSYVGLAGGGLGRLADHASVLDSLALAREKFPGQRNSLDALCRRLGIDNSHRELHGALLDAQLLAEVYLAMTAGQGLLGFGEETEQATRVVAARVQITVRPRVLRAFVDEVAAHVARLEAIDTASKGACLWKHLAPPAAEPLAEALAG